MFRPLFPILQMAAHFAAPEMSLNDHQDHLNPWPIRRYGSVSAMDFE
jgi:hypothetical protein